MNSFVPYMMIVSAITAPSVPAAYAQNKLGYCDSVISNICGPIQASECFSYMAMLSQVPDNCFGFVDQMLEEEQEIYSNMSTVSDYGQNDYCSSVMTNMCGFGQSVTDCMMVQGWGRVPQQCEGDFQAAIEMEREYYEHQAYEQNHGNDRFIISEGLSYGGHLREGPGTNYRSLGVLVEGDYVEIAENTGIYYQGVPWYHIYSPIGDGYHWGGIMCSYTYVEGVYSAC